MELVKQKLAGLKRHKSKVIPLMSLYPPFVGAGVRVERCSPDFRFISVRMNLKLWNQNYVGTQFGGSMFSMCDPFYMLMLIENLGPEYQVWDKSGSIDFLKPGRGTVWARFELSEAVLDDIREQVADEGRARPTFTIDIKDSEGEVVARVKKVISVRLRRE